MLTDLLEGTRASQPSPIAPLPPAPAPISPPHSVTSTGAGRYDSSVDTFPDVFAIGLAVVAALTVLVPFLIGHF